MKKIIISSLIIVLSLSLLCACSKEQNPSASPASSAGALEVKTGVVLEASTRFLQIESPEGSTYSFVVSDQTEIDGEGEGLGDTAEISYHGTYQKGMEAAKIKVIEKAKHEAESLVQNYQQPTPASQSQPSEEIRYVTGVVEDVTMNQIDILYSDGRVYSIKKDDNTVTEGNVELGCTVRVYHKGNFSDGILATTITVISDPEEPQTEEQLAQTARGVVTDGSNQLISIQMRDGQTITFQKNDSTWVEGEHTTILGNIVEVTYEGDIEGEPVAIKIVPSTIPEWE